MALARIDPKRQREFDAQKAWVQGLLAQAQLVGFYGKLTLTLEDGFVRRAVKEESLKPPTDEGKVV